jgi:hypothetical protein
VLVVFYVNSIVMRFYKFLFMKICIVFHSSMSNARKYIFIPQLSRNADMTVLTNHLINSCFFFFKKKNQALVVTNTSALWDKNVVFSITLQVFLGLAI